MKNYEEMARNVLAARDEHIRMKKKRQAAVRRYMPIVMGFCFSLLIGCGVWQHMHHLPPVSPVPESMTETGKQSETATELLTTEKPENVQTEQPATTQTIPLKTETDLTAATVQTQIAIPQETAVFSEKTSAVTTALTLPILTQTTAAPSTIAEPVGTRQKVLVPVITEPASTEPPITAPAMTEQVTTQSDSELSENQPGTETTSIPDADTNTDIPNRHWNEMPINQQFFMAELGDPIMTYSTSEKEVSANEVSEYICKAYMSGYDWYELIYYHCEAEAYKIKGDDEFTTIAIKFADDDKFYLYTLNQPNYDDQLSG